jgi:hypothetical protein
MPRHTLKLLALLAVFSVTPVAANHCRGGTCVTTAAVSKAHHSNCPYERAREAAAAAEAAGITVAPSVKSETRITLTDRVPSDSSLLGYSHGSSFLQP